MNPKDNLDFDSKPKDKKCGKNLRPPIYIPVVELCGVSFTSTFFYLANEVPTFNFIISSWVLFVVTIVMYKLTKTTGGDDQCQ